MGGSWAPLGASWGRLGGVLGRLWGVLGASCGLGASQERLEAVLRASWGRLWNLLGTSRHVLGRIGAILVRFGTGSASIFLFPQALCCFGWLRLWHKIYGQLSVQILQKTTHDSKTLQSRGLEVVWAVLGAMVPLPSLFFMFLEASWNILGAFG